MIRKDLRKGKQLTFETKGEDWMIGSGIKLFKDGILTFKNCKKAYRNYFSVML